jgi:hypothetical protein
VPSSVHAGPRWSARRVKLELAQWLAGPYRTLTERGTPVDEEPISMSPPSLVTQDRLTRMLDMMRVDVLLVLHELATPHGRSAFTSFAFDNDLVVRDDEGCIVPCARPRMGLVDRVLSLVAVDALTKSHEFEQAFFVCERCHLPAFDAQARANGNCRVHVSGVQHK